MASINRMVKACEGLLGTTDVNEWEQRFLENISRRTRSGQDTSSLTEKQVEVLERIFRKHFAA